MWRYFDERTTLGTTPERVTPSGLLVTVGEETDGEDVRKGDEVAGSEM
jgi:hypothetical protein